MKCPKCDFDRNPAGAHFCMSCGQSMEVVRQTNVNVSQNATNSELTGFQVENMRGSVSVNIQPLPPELLAKLMAMPTEVKASVQVASVSPAAAQDAPKPPTKQAEEDREDRESIHQAISELLKAAKAKGTEAINVGGVQTSRVELLLKKANLLRTDGEQIMWDNGQAIAKAQLAGQQPSPALYDDSGYSGKFKEAQSLLQEALTLDDANPEVMLHMAQILCETNRNGDTQEPERLLFRVQNLLNPPRNDTEKFWLAQAKFLTGTLPGGKFINAIPAARAMFEQLGRVDWVQQCDWAMQRASMQAAGAAPSPAGMVEFQPVGRWQVRANDGSSAVLDVYPNGSFASVIQSGVYGFGAQSAGQWGFIPANSLLRFQGFINGVIPFDLGVVIQGQQNGMYMASGTDGGSYFFQRVG